MREKQIYAKISHKELDRIINSRYKENQKICDLKIDNTKVLNR